MDGRCTSKCPRTTEVTADLDFVSPGGEGIYTSGRLGHREDDGDQLEHARPLPRRLQIRRPSFTASLKIPDGWKFGTSLPIANQNGSSIQFAPISLTLLVDSPVITGQYMKVVPLNPGKTPSVEMDIASDRRRAQSATRSWEQYKNLVTQPPPSSEPSTIATITLCSV